MLTGQVLNSDATLNSFEPIGSLAFIPGESVTLFIQLTQPQKASLRYMATSSPTLTVHLPNKDGTTTDLTMTVLAGDSSIWSGDIDSATTALISGGNLTFTLVEGANTTQGWIQSALSMTVTGMC